MSDLLLKAFDKEINSDLPAVNVGDSVTVYVRINVGDKNERVQMVAVLLSACAMPEQRQLYRSSHCFDGIVSGVERTFLVGSPRIEKIEIHSQSHVRRARLYYLRSRTGKRPVFAPSALLSNARESVPLLAACWMTSSTKCWKIQGERAILSPFFILASSRIESYTILMTTNHTESRPIIGLTTYRKMVDKNNPYPYMALMATYVEAVTAAGVFPCSSRWDWMKMPCACCCRKWMAWCCTVAETLPGSITAANTRILSSTSTPTATG